MSGCDSGVLVLRDLSRQVLLLSYDFGPDFSVISAHLVGHSIVVLSGPCLDTGTSSIGLTNCKNSGKVRICKLSMISFAGILLYEVRIANSKQSSTRILTRFRSTLIRARARSHFAQILRIWSHQVYCFLHLGVSLMCTVRSIWGDCLRFA